jgi:hypothetical protein
LPTIAHRRVDDINPQSPDLGIAEDILSTKSNAIGLPSREGYIERTVLPGTSSNNPPTLPYADSGYDEPLHQQEELVLDETTNLSTEDVHRCLEDGQNS